MITALIAAAASLPTVLGLQLGAPVSLPECERMSLRYPDPNGAPYESIQTHQCFERLGSSVDAIEHGMIYFPPETMSKIMSFNWVTDALVGGRLEQLGVQTLDYNHADYIVAQLSAKFGQPDEDRKSSEDIESIAVPSRIVIWSRPGYRVEYRSVNRQVESGLLIIQTDAALKAEQQEKQSEDAQRTPL